MEVKVTEECRIEFEKWCKMNDYSTKRHKVPSFYSQTQVNQMFDAWCSAWAVSRSNGVANNQFDLTQANPSQVN